jgi:hypothetical protein
LQGNGGVLPEQFGQGKLSFLFENTTLRRKWEISIETTGFPSYNVTDF